MARQWKKERKRTGWERQNKTNTNWTEGRKELQSLGAQGGKRGDEKIKRRKDRRGE